MLYNEDSIVRIRGTYYIKSLIQGDEENTLIEEFLDQKILLNSLFRILQEDRKKNTELTTNILEILFCFSIYTEKHGILLENKIGDTCMKITALEIKRYDIRKMETTQDSQYVKFLLRQEKLLHVCFYLLLNLSEDMRIQLKMVKRNIIKLLVHCLTRTNNTHRIFLDELLI
eukprot:UN22921